MTALAEALVAAQAELRDALHEMTTAVYEGTDDDRKIALTHLLDAWAKLSEAVETPLEDANAPTAEEDAADVPF